jgi:hypothetical protein
MESHSCEKMGPLASKPCSHVDTNRCPLPHAHHQPGHFAYASLLILDKSKIAANPC